MSCHVKCFEDTFKRGSSVDQCIWRSVLSVAFYNSSVKLDQISDHSKKSRVKTCTDGELVCTAAACRA
jgi:hypothetical protein